MANSRTFTEDLIRVPLLHVVLALVRCCLAVRTVVRFLRRVGLLPPKREEVAA